MKRLIMIGLIAITIPVILISLYFVFEFPQLNVDGISAKIIDAVSCQPCNISYVAGKPRRESVAFFQLDCDVSLTNFVVVSQSEAQKDYEKMIMHYAGSMEVKIGSVDEVRTYRGDTFTLLHIMDGDRRLIMYLGGL